MRLIAVAIGTGLFYLTRRNLLIGVASGTIALTLLAA
jgi:hypothetical protein